jgi:hypothetical protein
MGIVARTAASLFDRLQISVRFIRRGSDTLRFGRSSGGNTAGLELVETAGQPVDKLWALSPSKQPSDDGCYENGKAWILERGWVANASELAPGIFTGFRQTQKKARRKWRAEGE